jgi:hypothetical protein
VAVFLCSHIHSHIDASLHLFLPLKSALRQSDLIKANLTRQLLSA